MKRITVQKLKDTILHAGDTILLSGVIYTARDAAHMRIMELFRNGEDPPFPLEGAVIYYAGPSQTPEGRIIGSIGPTTAGRMNAFAPEFYRRGMAGAIGKGPVGDEVKQAIHETNGVYLCAVGGAGALYASCVREVSVLAFPELGCEAVRRLIVCDMPLIVGEK